MVRIIKKHCVYEKGIEDLRVKKDYLKYVLNWHLKEQDVDMSTMRNREVLEKTVSNKRVGTEAQRKSSTESRSFESNWQSTANHSLVKSFHFFLDEDSWSLAFFFGRGFLISGLGHHRLQGWMCEPTERECEYFVGVWIQRGALLPSAVSKLVESLQEKLRICALRSDQVEQANWKGYSYTV